MARDPRRIVDAPRYSFAESDRLAGVSRSTTKRWLLGYQYRSVRGGKVDRPPVTVRDLTPVGVSFRDLVEIVAIGGLRRLHFSLGDIRRIVTACQDLFHVERPLTTMTFRIGGREVFVGDAEDRLIEVLHGRGRQAWAEVLAPFLQNLEYESDIARRWWPLGRKSPIVIDPAYAFGLPVIAKTGIRTEIVFERFAAGDQIGELAAEFRVTPVSIERAVQFEASRLNAA